MAATATFATLTRTREIHKHSTHHLRGDGEEMNAVFPFEPLEIGQTQIRFVNQRGRLERVPRPLAGHIVTRQAPQFVINDGREPIEGVRIPSSPGPQQSSDLSGGNRPGAPVRWFHGSNVVQYIW